MNATTLTTGWCKLEAGRYARYHRGVYFTAEYDPETKLWYCRRQDLVFDSARTLREAKDYCVEPEGRPLIEIL